MPAPDPTTIRNGGPALVVLAAGLSTRYGRLKQLDPVGPAGQALMDYTIADAVEAGVRRVVMVVREEIREEVRAHVLRQLERQGLATGVQLVTAVQRIDDLPDGRTPPPDRTRPWGTAHALHAARDALRDVSAFVLVNADDGYGRDAIRRIVAWAAQPPPADEFALVPFRLDATLSEHGGVSRGIVEVDAAGHLRDIREALDIHVEPAESDASGGPRHGGEPGRTRRAWGRWSTEDADDGQRAAFDLAAPVSLNLWGFTPRMSGLVEDGLRVFFDELSRGSPASGEADREYYLPTVVRTAVARGTVRVRVLETATTHLGMTHPEDRAPVVAALAADPSDH